jgi:iron complex transport system ATP-binding protein
VAVVLHDLALAARYADRIAVLREGRVAAEGRPAETITPALLAAVFGVEAKVESAGGRMVIVVERPIG